MELKYKHIFFDLDHTLWDFEKNSQETLEHLYHHYGLKNFGVQHPDDFIVVYEKINHAMWAQYNRGEIDKATLREKRFTDSFAALGVNKEHIPQGIWQLYLDICPTKTNVFPHALEVLEYLHDRYTLSIITNGFEETQHRKLSHSGIAPFINHVLTSESIGFAKPDPRIFEHLLSTHGAGNHEAIMIGDNIETDIGGAKAAGIDHIFFNPEKIPHSHSVQAEIHSLLQLKELL